MAQDSLIWGGTTLGDAPSPDYDPDAHGDFLRDLFMHDRRDSGVLKTNLTGYTGELLATNPAGATLRVATGAGMVDGTIYYNSANVDNGSGSAPGQFERIVLRKGWAAQTVRVAVLGPAGGIPALTQNAGVTWEIPIATVENVGGVLTFTDERVFLPQIGTENLADGSVGINYDLPPTSRPSYVHDPIADGVATAAKFADGAKLTLIDSTVLGAPAATINLSGISALYTHLMIIMFARSTGAGINDILMQFNSDAGANYAYINTDVDEASAINGSTSVGQTSILIAGMNDSGSPANVFSPVIIEIANYSNGVWTKSAMAHSALIEAAAGNAFRHAGWWDDVESIDEIDLIASGGNFATGTMVSLYGRP